MYSKLLTLFAFFASLAVIVNAQPEPAPADQFARAELVYGTSVVQARFTNIAVAFYNSNNEQVNPATIDVSTFTVTSSASGFFTANISDSGFGVQFDGYFLTTGEQTLTFGVNGATVTAQITVTPVPIESYRFIEPASYAFQQGVETQVSVALYDDLGAQINPEAIDISTVTVSTLPAGTLTVTDLAIGAFGLQFKATFATLGEYSIALTVNGNTLYNTVIVLGASSTPSPSPSTSAPSTPTPTSSGSSSESGDGTCNPEVKVVAREGGSYIVEGQKHQVYDIALENAGSCGIVDMNVVITFSSASAVVVQSWNYNSTTGVISHFGGVLAPSNAFGSAGFILAGDATIVSATATGSCGSCSPTGSNPDLCEAGAFVGASKRPSPGGSWSSGGKFYQIYDISFYNNGKSSVTGVTLSLSADAGVSVASVWNLKFISGNSYEFDLYGTTVAPSQSFMQTSGVIVSASSEAALAINVAIKAVSCK